MNCIYFFKFYFVLVLSLLLGACSGGGGGGTPTDVQIDLTGNWIGTWSSSVVSYGGTISIDITHSGTSVTGAISMTDSPCISSGNASGTASGGNFSASIVSGQDAISLQGTYTDTLISGTYSVPSGTCVGDSGTFSLSRISNTAPVITSPSAITVEENTTAVLTVTATDAESDSLSYSLSDGMDQAAFAIDAATGAVSFTSAPDYEVPTDANSDNVYEVQVSVSDGSFSTTQDITITVSNKIININSESGNHQPLDGTWLACYNKSGAELDAADRHIFTDTDIVLEEYRFESTDGTCSGQPMVTLHWLATLAALDDLVTSGWVDNTNTVTSAPQNQANTGSLSANPVVTKLNFTMGDTTPPGPTGDVKYFYYMDDTATTWCMYRNAGPDGNVDGYRDYVGDYDLLCKESGAITPLATTINADSGTMQLLDGIWSSPCRNTGGSDYMEQHVIAGGTFKMQHVFYSTSDTSCTAPSSVTVDAEGTVTALDNFVTAGWHDGTNPSTAPTPQSGTGSLTDYPTVTKLIIDIPSGAYAGSTPYFYYMDDSSVTWCIYRPAGPDGDSDGYDDYVSDHEPLCKISTP